MTKYRVSVEAQVEYTVEVEAEDETLAELLAEEVVYDAAAERDKYSYKVRDIAYQTETKED